ncbi:hypothetical protein Fmac_011708 [Flemingia macrophylla]|uniref:DCD domain-containing protein n=1 Tax=Flemingia macrophylla TaxID=520843 RepID=A0ABD1MP30_9FABA
MSRAHFSYSISDTLIELLLHLLTGSSNVYLLKFACSSTCINMGLRSKKDRKNPPEESSCPQSSEKDYSNKDTNPAAGSSKPEQSNKNTPQSLKAKSQIAKKSKGGEFKAVINKGSPLIGRKRRLRKNKKVVDNRDELPKEVSEKDGRNKEKEDQNKNTGSSEKRKEKLGGFIFMCSAKTKPDCFRYNVMGVSAAKIDIVSSIKPGTKLFLYDFDLRLLYGIYKAASSGGKKLEPRAFGGNFPAQVRFNVASDCFPLPESIFKKAIKENYNEKNKFKTELTPRQVRKLTELFRPVGVRSGLQPVHSLSKAIIHDRDALDGVRGSWSHLHRDRDTQIELQGEIPRDLFLTEKSYRAYGLQGDRRNRIPASQVNPMPDPYERDYEREHLHPVDPLYRKNVPAYRENLHADPHHLNERELQAYLRGGISEDADDPYHPYHYGASPRDPYLPPRSREEISSRSYLAGGRTLIGGDTSQRREAAQDRLFSTYSAADALSEYNRMHRYQESLEATAVPVSSRYSFAGPSYSLR